MTSLRRYDLWLQTPLEKLHRMDLRVCCVGLSFPYYGEKRHQVRTFGRIMWVWLPHYCCFSWGVNRVARCARCLPCLTPTGDWTLASCSYVGLWQVQIIPLLEFNRLKNASFLQKPKNFVNSSRILGLVVFLWQARHVRRRAKESPPVLWQTRQHQSLDPSWGPR